MVVHTWYPSNGGKPEIRGWQFGVTWAKKQDTFSKIIRAKMAGCTAQAVLSLPSKHKALSSNFSSAKKQTYFQKKMCPV
jgi:hypothetical protein